MKALVTGGAGFVGSRLVQSLLDGGHSVFVLENPATAGAAALSALANGGRLLEADLTNASAVRAAVGRACPDAVVHCAALISFAPGAAVADQAAINVVGTVNLLEAMRAAGVRRGILVSSEEVYGEFRTDPVSEDHPFDPRSAYGITKAAAELYWRHYRRVFGLELASARTFWVYGPRYPRRRFEKSIILDALTGVPSRFDLGADQLIDYTHVDDVTDGLVALLEAPRLGSDAYNLSGGHARSLGTIARILEALLPEAEISVGAGLLEYEPGVSMPQKGTLDISRLRAETGFAPHRALEKGLEEYAAHLRQQVAAAGSVTAR